MQNARSAHPNIAPPRFKPLQIAAVFRYLDWMSIGLYVLIMLLSPRLPDALEQLFLPTWICYGGLAGLFGLSFILPQQWKLGQRRLYIFSSYSLVLFCLLTGWGFDLILYILIAKACFLVSRRDLAIFLLCGGGIWTGVQAWNVYQLTINYDKYRTELVQNQQGTIISTAVGNTGLYIVASAFVMLMSFIILQEQQSRAKAEQLTAEMEILAATVERSRIAREIHDSLGHRLTTLDVQLELAQKLQYRDPAQVSQSIDIAKQLAHQCLQDVRHAVHSMANQSFDLNAAMQMLVQPLQTNPELRLEICTELPPLPATLSHQIYCIVQEGLTNIQRHSKANKITLQGYTIADHIHVKLSDNGIGFNLDQSPTGFGLRSMHERAQLIGGQLTLDSAPNQGTQIHLTIPPA
jgi:signal transduction histidine kinase